MHLDIIMNFLNKTNKRQNGLTMFSVDRYKDWLFEIILLGLSIVENHFHQYWTPFVALLIHQGSKTKKSCLRWFLELLFENIKLSSKSLLLEIQSVVSLKKNLSIEGDHYKKHSSPFSALDASNRKTFFYYVYRVTFV